MTLIKLEDMTSTLKKVAEEGQNSAYLSMVIGFIAGMVERTPRYVIPDELLEPFKQEAKEPDREVKA